MAKMQTTAPGALVMLWWAVFPGALMSQAALTYAVDLNDRADDLFHVEVNVSGWTNSDGVFQFPSTAPGTYQVMDIGRYVRDFSAFDGNGVRLEVEPVSTNQWRVLDAARVSRITYSIGETWDTPVDRNPIYPMAGTSIETDHVLINPHAVFGYPTGMQETPVRLQLDYPDEWTVGTALNRDDDGTFLADDYDHFVDSPVLLGTLTTASLDVTGVPVEIFVYSQQGGIQAEQLLGAMREMLLSAGDFLGGLPVDRYTFLYHFENVPGRTSMGAWEHSYSSEYVLPDFPYSDQYGAGMTDIAAHEFFHVITPLNIHSEIVENFNFVTPVASQHLWLYEGTTEWASHMMQLRTGLKDLDTFLQTLIQKMRADAGYDANYSLLDLSLNSYSDAGQVQYGNIYQRGALAATLLDIRILELSGGTRGFREVIHELMDRYGKENAFPEADFFDVFEDMTYPEIGTFMDRYVRSAEPLPVKEYFEKLGINLIEDDNGNPVRFEVDPNPTSEQLRLRTAWLALRLAA